MLANNIWKIIGDLIEMTLAPYETLRLGTDTWWSSNIVGWFFIAIGFIAFFYWMNLMFGYKRAGKEDEA